MAASTDIATLMRLRALFADPSLEGMLTLEWEEFEDFVQHVFEQAGFHVTKVARHLKRQYVDLELRLHAEGAVLAHVEVRRYRTAHIIRAKAVQFLGALVAKRVPRGYMVTTSDFTQPARRVAQESDGRMYLLNGRQLLRYIEYVRGSRLTDEDDALVRTDEQPIPPEYILAAEAIPRADAAETAIVAMANNKGGVAKTTSAVELALVLSERLHQRVLVIDTDGQANATALLPPLDPPRPRGGTGTAGEHRPAATHRCCTGTARPSALMDYFLGRKTLAALVRPTRFERLWLIPSDDRLVNHDMGDGPGAARVCPRYPRRRARRAGWGRLRLDPPRHGAGADLLHAGGTRGEPVRRPPGLRRGPGRAGANVALRTTRTMHALMREGVELLGCLVTRWRRSAPSEKALTELVDLMRNEQMRLGGSADGRPRVYADRIPEDPRVERGHLATRGGLLRHLFHLTSGGAAATYEAFAKELIADVKRG
jgi:restriction endonuclease/AAA domain-containing protein